MSDSSADRDPIEMLAASFLERFRRGERPSIEEYAAKYPELADEIRELLPALVMLEQEKSVAGVATGTGPGPGAPGPGPAPARRLPDLARDRPGRHGRGVRIRPAVAGSPRGAEGAASSGAGRLVATGAVPAGGPCRGATAPHQHRARLRRRGVRRSA